MRYLVVGDAHGKHRLVRRLLEAAGVVDADGVRIRDPEVRTIQLGDLVTATQDTREDDAAILRKARAWFDVCLVGNHEYPYLGGYGFGGFHRSNEIERLVHNVFWHPAVAVGGTLLTHAGVAELLGLRARTAQDAVVEISEAWLADRGHPFFALCSPKRVGGKDFVGGILWKDWAEPRSLAFSQIHGHTPIPDGPVFVGDREGIFCGNLDVGARGGRVAGVWLDEDGRPGEIVEARLASTGRIGENRAVTKIGHDFGRTPFGSHQIEARLSGPICDGAGKLDLGPQGSYPFVGERYAPCPGCRACRPRWAS